MYASGNIIMTLKARVLGTLNRLSFSLSMRGLAICFIFWSTKDCCALCRLMYSIFFRLR